MRIATIALLCSVLCPLASAHAAPPDKPNVILVLVDDLGWRDLSCQGSEYYRTPHVDKLAATGMRFTQGYAACAVCSPTRAAVQTGRYPHRLGVTDWIRALFQRGNLGTPDANPTDYVGSPKRRLLCPPNPYWMEHDEVTLAEMLKRRGYKTAYIGKWHLGDEAWYPPAQGFDVNLGGCDYGQPPSYFDPYTTKRLPQGIPSLEPRKEGEYLTDREGDEAVRLIEKWKDGPFFIQLSHYAVHTPIQAKDDVTAKYKDIDAAKRQGQPAYAAMVESVDDAMGRILAALDQHGLADKTIVVFTSDNGGLLGPTNNTPLRSGKGYAYEGGIRVPLIVRYPGVTDPGSVSATPVSSIDLVPTLAAAAGATLPDRPIDGADLTGLLCGKPLPDRDLIWHFPHYRHGPGHDPYSIIRAGDYKLIRFYDPAKVELYHVNDDVSEKNNLAAQMPDKVQALEAKLDANLKSTGAKLPKPNPDYKGE